MPALLSGQLRAVDYMDPAVLVFGMPPSVRIPPLPFVNVLRSPNVFSVGVRYGRLFFP